MQVLACEHLGSGEKKSWFGVKGTTLKWNDYDSDQETNLNYRSENNFQKPSLMDGDILFFLEWHSVELIGTSPLTAPDPCCVAWEIHWKWKKNNTLSLSVTEHEKTILWIFELYPKSAAKPNRDCSGPRLIPHPSFVKTHPVVFCVILPASKRNVMRYKPFI